MKVVMLYPTRRCNLACKYCYQKNKKNEDMTCNTLDKVLSLIAEGSEQTKLNFFGGEPLLRWDLITYAVKKLPPSIKTGITTNGTLLTEDKLEFMRAHGMGLALSLDGPPGVSRKTRPGSENVDIGLIARYYPDAQIIMTLSPDNIADMFRSTMWFIDKGFRNIAHNVATESRWPTEAEIRHALQFEELADWYIRNWRHPSTSSGHAPSRVSGQAASFMFIGYAMKAVRQAALTDERRNICGASKHLIAIDTNGDIYPCQDMVTCDTEGKYRLGNIDTGYTPAERIPLTEMKFPDREKCRLCWFYNQCVGGCGPKNLLTCGDRFGVSGNGCGLYRAQVREGMRALLNTGQLAVKPTNTNRKDKGPKHGGK
jgi:uncharacterized protein